MLTQKAVATARRNLVQRIERFWARHDETAADPISVWQRDHAFRAIELLRAGEYPDGERVMMYAEQPAFYKAGYVSPERTDADELMAYLKAPPPPA